MTEATWGHPLQRSWAWAGGEGTEELPHAESICQSESICHASRDMRTLNGISQLEKCLQMYSVFRICEDLPCWVNGVQQR